MSSGKNPVADLHTRIDQQAKKLEELHASRLMCKRGCAACCVDDITVFRIEADHIKAHTSNLLQSQEPAPPGRCAFLDEDGACRIYPQRPYVCRTQGLPLRWIEEDEDWNLQEYRDICPLNEEGEPIEDLSEEDCWTIGDAEAELAALEEKTHGNLQRVALRDLWPRPNQDERAPE
ncbi:MAG: YkgJ family cysteine cluster protein [Acidobacteriota bacterium]|nr:YkgJ family cysteine cluster protein [Acidobacteriota bacterium]